MPEQVKRAIAYKLRIGELLRGNQIIDQSQISDLDKSVKSRLLYLELGDKKIIRVNLIANVVDKFESQGETKFITITLDDGTGQIRARVFGDNLPKFQNVIQGDTLLIIGFLRSFNQELYILPEIVRKQEPRYLLIRKLEIEKSIPKPLTYQEKQKIKSFRDELLEIIKASEKNQGIDKEEIIIKFKNAKPEIISQEIIKLIEDGVIYEPRPGRVRYLG